MKELERLFRKKNKLVIGLMSGTSADGLDAVLIRITGSGTSTRITRIAFETFPYPPGYRAHLMKNSDPSTARIDEIARLDMWIARFSADAIRRLVRKSGYRIDQIDLIGSHGQTVQHCPLPRPVFGKQVRATLQIGNPSAIAKQTGIVTIGDFRPADIAAGGTGAPLVPLFDYLMMRSNRYNRGVLNIGGIANITILPRNGGITRVLAFDTGPGNMAIDGCMQYYFNKPFDMNGSVAASGSINSPLLNRLMAHPYLKIAPPKSTGREVFGNEFLRQIIAASRTLDPADIITTMTEFTAASIYSSYLRHIKNRMRLDEIIVSGGGVHNRTLMNSLGRYFSDISIRTSDDLQIPSDAKEAICFALLANETIAGHPGNIPGATGARRPAILGTIALP